MKYLFLFLLMAFQLEASPVQFAESAITQVIGLTDVQKNKFCRKGDIFNYSIRSKEGELCKNPVGASIAWLACHDQEGFANSNCAKKASALKITDVETARETLSQVLDFKLTTVSDLCNIIVKVLPDQASNCSKIAASLVAPTAPKAPVNLAQSIINGLKIYLDRYNNTTAITSGGGGRSLTVDLAFLPHSMEALYEAKDFFNNGWQQNQAKLKKLSEETKVAGFANQEGFIAVSVGSSSTQCYYMENGQVKTLQYLFGTNPSATKSALIEKMAQDLKALKRPVVFFNSISFAELVQNAESVIRTTDSINLKNSLFKATKLNKDGQPMDDSAGVTANQIAQKLSALNIDDAFIFKPLDGSKFINKWTNALALESANIPKKGIGFIGDIGGGGMSGKLFLDGKFYDKPNLVLAYLGEGSKADEYYDQADIVKHYNDGKGGVHKTLIQNMDKLLASVKDFIVSGKLKDDSKAPKEVLKWIENNQNTIKNQKNFYFLIRQTGQLRELYEKMMKQLGLALEAFKKSANVLPNFSLFT